MDNHDVIRRHLLSFFLSLLLSWLFFSKAMYDEYCDRIAACVYMTWSVGGSHQEITRCLNRRVGVSKSCGRFTPKEEKNKYNSKEKRHLYHQNK